MRRGQDGSGDGARRPRGPRPLRLRLPATSANLGPGFDAAAVALELWLEMRAEAAEATSIRAAGRDRELCGATGPENLVLATYREILAAAGRPAPELALRARNEIPIGKGCGSSAAARWAGMLLANHFGGLGWSERAMLAEVARREGHGDNAAACRRGGFVCCQNGGASGEEIAVAGSRRAAGWPVLLAVPAAALATEKAREVVPRQFSRADAVANLQGGMRLAAAFLLGRRELLARAMRDRWHEPPRSALCPLLAALKPLAGANGIAGVALSGAGPSVLLILNSAAESARARRAAAAALRAAGLEAEWIPTRVAARGAEAKPERVGGAAEAPGWVGRAGPKAGRRA